MVAIFTSDDDFRHPTVQLCKSDNFVGAGIAYQFVWESPTERNIGPLTAEPPKILQYKQEMD